MADISLAQPGVQGGLDPEQVRAFLKADPAFLRDDADLLAELGLRGDPGNLLDFGPAALARVNDARRRESSARRRLEANARANFAAQAQTHAAVVEILESRNNSDLAARLDEIARARFGLAAAVMALEGPARVPAGWRPMAPGQIDLLLGRRKTAKLGIMPTAAPLFGPLMEEVRSVALVRLAIGADRRTGLLAFGSREEQGFTPDMGAELIRFLAQVVERTAQRWPIL